MPARQLLSACGNSSALSKRTPTGTPGTRLAERMLQEAHFAYRVRKRSLGLSRKRSGFCRGNHLHIQCRDERILILISYRPSTQGNILKKSHIPGSSCDESSRGCTMTEGLLGTMERSS